METSEVAPTLLRVRPPIPGGAASAPTEPVARIGLTFPGRVETRVRRMPRVAPVTPRPELVTYGEPWR